MKRIFTKRGVILILLTPPAFFLVVFLLWPFTPAGRQDRHMKLAREHGRRLATAIRDDKRFEFVEFTGNTRETLVVQGIVQTTNDLEALRTIVENSKSPRPVDFFTKVYPDFDAYRKWREESRAAAQESHRRWLKSQESANNGMESDSVPAAH